MLKRLLLMFKILHHLSCVQPNKLWEVSTTINLWRMSTIDSIRQYDSHEYVDPEWWKQSICAPGKYRKLFLSYSPCLQVTLSQTTVPIRVIHTYMLVVLYIFLYTQCIPAIPRCCRGFQVDVYNVICWSRSDQTTPQKATRAAMEERQRRFQAGQLWLPTSETSRPLPGAVPLASCLV